MNQIQNHQTHGSKEISKSSLIISWTILTTRSTNTNSDLEHFEISLCDPAFYQFYKRTVIYFQKYKSYRTSYTYDDLYFPGVKFDDVQVDKLYTFFDYFFSEISNAFYKNEKKLFDDSFRVRVSVQKERLNYKPFTYRMYMKSRYFSQILLFFIYILFTKDIFYNFS